MRLSNLFSRTWREAPSEAEMPSHQLLVRAGYIRQLSSGIYSYLPLGRLALEKVTEVVRKEMLALGGQEVLMPLVQPAAIWRQSGRYDAPAPGPALVRFQDRSSHEMVLAMTHEEAVTDLARQMIQSYKQLPSMVYQFQTKFRDEPRARGGLVRQREFLMKDGYSFHADAADLDAFYPEVYGAYERILQRCGLEYVVVQAYSGMMGGAQSNEFMVLNDQGEDTLMMCDACRYAANLEAATLDKTVASTEAEPLPLERVATPGASTIAALAEFLDIPESQTLKAVLYQMPDERVIFCVIRGDLDVNEDKVAALLGDVDLTPATPESLQALGIAAGYASPRGIDRDGGLAGCTVIVDDSVPDVVNGVAGANETGYHLRNVNYGRDFTADTVADIALARVGDPCPRCGQPLVARRGIEVGHIFKLGTKYSQMMNATYLDTSGRAQPLVMGCYGIGIGRLLACVVEQHHDEHGIVWPAHLAPMDVHIVSLGGRNAQVAETTDALYDQLTAAGFAVLLDDRNERAGVKFNDADLIGLPVRITVGERGLKEGNVELKRRHEDERVAVAVECVVDVVAAALAHDDAKL